MSESSNVIRGTLHDDGTLELAERPSLPAGQVEVTIRPVVEVAKAGNLWETMQRGRAELELSGHRFRTKEEIDADIEDMRDWGEEKLDEAKPPSEGYGPYLARIRARREAEGFPFRTQEEIDAEVEELRSWDDRSDDGLHEEGGESRDSNHSC